MDDKDTLADLIPQLTAKTNELVSAGWEPDDKTKADIKSAIKTQDADAVNKLISMLNDVTPAALALHGEDANA